MLDPQDSVTPIAQEMDPETAHAKVYISWPGHALHFCLLSSALRLESDFQSGNLCYLSKFPTICGVTFTPMWSPHSDANEE